MTKKNVSGVRQPAGRQEVSEDQAGDDVQNDAIIGRALRISLGLVAVFGCLILAILAIAQLAKQPVAEKKTELVLPKERQAPTVTKPTISLVDITSESGIDWRHFNAMEGEKLLPETMGGGVSIFDFDGDGDQDVLLVGGQSWSWSRSVIGNPRSLCLYANDGQAKFTDVTEQVGLKLRVQAMGATVGDYDNDGWADLLVTGVGGTRLFQNQQGKFADVTEAAGVGGRPEDWTTCAVWFDYDNDSRLDLFIGNYVLWSRQLDLSIGFSLTGVGRAYGQPTSFTGMFSYLYHNDGDGRFTDVSKQAGFHISNPNTPVPEGKALGVSMADFNRDGWQDLLVANDTVRNYLYINQRNGSFKEEGIPMGIAFDRNGEATGAMGIDSACFRNGDSLGVIIGNFANEPCSLYVSNDAGAFLDEAMPSGLGPVTRLSLTFGAFFADLDLDGRMDIACANGHLESEISKVQPNQRYAQPPLFFWNAGSQGSTELVRLDAEQIGKAALEPMVGRGAAYGDLDGDGDLDMVLVANGGPPRVLRNDQKLGHHWLRILLKGSKSNRDAIGAQLRLVTPSGKQTRCVTGTRSYLSQCELPVTFGLGPHAEKVNVEIQWPNGQIQKVDGLAVDQLHVISEP
ncbi:MAG: CRTAC1 family protein [Pirellulaceae bacterium]|nr:CRTAC1 family protein [Pirellulaceae bacterium]